MSKNNGGPAFPTDTALQTKGMTLLDYFAAKAPVTIKDAQEWFQDIEGRPPTGGEIMTILSSMSGMYADAMLLERVK